MVATVLKQHMKSLVVLPSYVMENVESALRHTAR